MFSKIKRALLGNPLASHREKHERLSVPIGLAVFAADALSSTAYATEEILIAFSATVFAAKGTLLAIPVALAIVLLMIIVVISYIQVIRTCPDGGGSYEVSRKYLGVLPSQIAGGALTIDYILTVAVSVSAGVAAITSAQILAPEYKTMTAILLVVFIMLLNLRGVKESGRAIAVPAYGFIVLMVVMIAVGLFKVVTGHVVPLEHVPAGTPDIGASIGTLALTLALLNAFSHGCAALTGIESISNGVKAFEEPSDISANKTMILMGCILGTVFLGVTVLAYYFNVSPNASETIVSQVARAVFGKGFLYYAIQIVTMIILILAANTSFSGFPRLATIMARDGFLPRQLMSLGDRLVFSNGIIILGVFSILLIWLKDADTHSLIPLYAVGVFLCFTDGANWHGGASLTKI